MRVPAPSASSSSSLMPEVTPVVLKFGGLVAPQHQMHTRGYEFPLEGLEDLARLASILSLAEQQAIKDYFEIYVAGWYSTFGPPEEGGTLNNYVTT